MDKILIQPVTNEKNLKAFVKFPFQLYQGHPCWLPPLLQQELNTFRPGKNVSLKHVDYQLFTACREGKTVGRIACFINELETQHLGEKHARFGWIDFIDDREVSQALLEYAESWARERQCKWLKGPFGFNQLDKCGWLTEGFDTLGVNTTIYNFPYYIQHLREMSYVTDLQWLEVELKMWEQLPERFTRYTRLVVERYGLHSKMPESSRELVEIGHRLFDLMMETYHQLPGFVPISEEERANYIQRYIRFLRKDFVCVVLDAQDEPIGFGVTMPSLSKALKKANGHLLPFGIFHLLAARQWNDTADLVLIGVKEEWRKRGVHSVVFSEIGKAFIRAGIRRVQVAPMQTFNVHVLSLWKDFEHKVYKRRETLKKALEMGH
jgi:hypothetical protein